MKRLKIVKVFTDRYPLIGPIMWILSVQYFIVQLIVAKAWSMPYSLASNTISDLGNTYCGIYSGRYICSPLHSFMNGSFIILGLFMTLGSMFIYQEFRETSLAFIGFGFLLLAGIGTLLVGLFPENTNGTLHIIGAILPFLIGNAGITILGYALQVAKSLRFYSILSGVVSLIALVFFTSHHYLGIGIGGMERITAYPQTVWLFVFGVYMSKNHLAKTRPTK